MLIDNDPMVNSYISVPKEMSQLNCAAFVAGIIEAVLDGCLFPGRVTAHSVPTEQLPAKTVFLSITPIMYCIGQQFILIKR